MSTATITIIWCDGVDCPREGQPYTVAPYPPDMTKTMYRRQAAEHGWKTNWQGKDYCDDCAAQLKVRKK